jgi:hypothetical protein
MYAVVEYNNYRRKQQFEVITTTDDIEYAKRLAFQNAKKNLPTEKSYETYKITTNIEDEYLTLLNKTIIAYQIVCLEKCKNKVRFYYSFSIVYAVIELEILEQEYPEPIDDTLIKNDYLTDEYYSSSDSD